MTTEAPLARLFLASGWRRLAACLVLLARFVSKLLIFGSLLLANASGLLMSLVSLPPVYQQHRAIAHGVIALIRAQTELVAKVDFLKGSNTNSAKVDNSANSEY